MEKSRKTIMLVDDNPINLNAGKTMLKDKYDVYPLLSGEKLFAMLEKVTPDLILLDIEMPELSGYEVIKILKTNPKYEEIPVIFLTSWNDSGSELEGLSLGAIDYVAKPFSPPLLLKRIEIHLLMAAQKKELKDYNDNLQKKVEDKTRQVVKLQNSILITMTELVEFRDETTGGHIERTQGYVEIMLKKIFSDRIYWEDVSLWNFEFLIASVPLHDVGKIRISDTILNKPGKLMPEEFEIMKKHAIYGEEAIEAIMRTTSENDFLKHAKIFAGAHHEKWDGSGYPRGLKGLDIPLQGRLMAISDVYDALISERPYKKAMSHDEAIGIIREGKGQHFDPVLVDLLDDLAPLFRDNTEKTNLMLRQQQKA
ncbi:HD domain-containing phosphohydrolase [Leadbettera azotonutricia]|uniref:Response regulator receiver HD domain protein n=1 Tax=Leadbettera azotonutricia (strain ATCC BAA-888 / DSM 13862 / ZAS-9) TaxID=545695 RepID=F5Y903_LEAAZ|nr:HD domain-containing phosphohydrolase [Leadbettera azotonutricia]AEF81723.1 response regulator receiver HD domain protein [Leadbettera azotonutricia ZAS-9]